MKKKLSELCHDLRETMSYCDGRKSQRAREACLDGAFAFLRNMTGARHTCDDEFKKVSLEGRKRNRRKR